ncbi:HEXXH motif domain-containing protein [Actinorugispora endophytica]|uniref:HEXXH motif-containing protein n=1 Tax=Actinorugispora endophytica TaxID=1605990 RepID=A0A4R6V0I7_9ACTN|nr:HEXXH motif domain-containing protein [Actinorugispora endophytica]TDQ53464.1 HEXXH motif-containing protein [Actinorugispora endophytica]
MSRGAAVALAPHTLSDARFAALARGLGDGSTVALLRAAQLSKRLVRLRALHDAARDSGLAVWFLPGYALLARVQRTAPDAVREVLTLPQVGAWAAHTLRRLRGSVRLDEPLWADVAHIGAVAAAAAVRAGVDFSVEVPVREGAAALPGLGLARIGGTAATALVRGSGGRATVYGDGRARVPLPEEPGVESPDWLPVRRVAVEQDGLRLSVALEDLDPYRDPHGLGAAPRLSADDAARWRRVVGGAWRLLVRDHPEYAAGVASGLGELVPLRGRDGGKGRNATSADSFGSASVSEPADEVSLAVGLLHEFQHAKLGALMDLIPLHGACGDRVFYAPWRDDPRPLPGLLHGVYAHMGVADFWRARRDPADGPDAEFARFEFTRWHAQTRGAADTVARSGLLTPAGRRFLDGLRARLAETAPEAAAEPPSPRPALDASADHALLWRLRNLRPDPAALAELARAWTAGERPRPLRVPLEVTAGSGAPAANRRLDLLVLLLRAPDRCAAPRAGTAGASEADVALLEGRADDARAGYRALIRRDRERIDAWAGLALARSLSAPPAGNGRGDPLRERPEVVLGLHRVLHGHGADADPESLASWLPDLGPDPAPDGVRA